MSFIVVGTNYKYSPIEVRGKLAFGKKKLRQALLSLLDYAGIKEAVILSTCNRVELYADVSDIEKGVESLKRFLSDYQHQALNKISPYLYTYIGKEAVFHLFSVAAGIDSQIIGETQILEQIKFAHSEAKTVEATDNFLDKIINQAINVGIKARKETGISKGNISLGSLSIDLIKKRLGPLRNKKILIIGVGKISELVIESLSDEEIKTIFIANRTIKRANELAKLINAAVFGFDNLKEKLREVDIVICATSSPHLILKKEDILEALSHRPSAIDHRSLLIIDLGVPRNVDPEIKHIKDIRLLCLDDLDFLNIESLNKRRKEAPFVGKIIQEEAEKLWIEEALKSEPAGACLP